MTDQTLICQNCNNQFVYSVYEQQQNQIKKLPDPILCPICTAIKQQEKFKIPRPNK